MNIWLRCWSAYYRLTQRWPALAAIVPFIPVVALWIAVTEAGVFPRAFLPGPLDVVRSFVTLTYKGILPDYLQDSLIRLFTGAALGHGARHSPGRPDRHQPMGAPHLLADPAVFPGYRRHRLAADPPDLVRLRADDDDVCDRLYRAVSGGAQHRSRGESVPRDLARAARSLGASPARVLWEVTLPGALPNIITGLRNGLGYGWRALIAVEMIVGTSGIGFLMFDARRAGSVVEILLGMIILGLLWYIVDAWILAPIERATGQRWGLVTSMKTLSSSQSAKDLFRSLRGVACHGGPRCLARRPAGRVRLGGRTVRLRQDHDSQHGRRLHSVFRRRDPARRQAVLGPVRNAAWYFSRSHCFPGRPCSTMSASGRKCAACRRPSATGSRTSIWRLPACRMPPTAIPTNCPAACSSASAWCGRWPTIPTVLLMDEPFASVDAQTRMTLQEELTRIWQERRPTVIFITHDVAEAVFLANRVVVLSKGRMLDQVEVGCRGRGSGTTSIEDDDVQAPVGAGPADGALRHEHCLGNRGSTQGTHRPRRGRRMAGFQLWLTLAAPGKISAELGGTSQKVNVQIELPFHARTVSRSGVPAIWKGHRHRRPFDRTTWCQTNGPQRRCPAVLGDGGGPIKQGG